MKKLKYVWLFIAGLCLISVLARADVFDDIANALKGGNAKDVGRYFDSSVELKILDKDNVYSHNQAEIVLKDFFDHNQVKNFTVIHRGASAKGALYAIGKMETTNGAYRTYIYIKDVGGVRTIQALTFEQQ